MATNHRIIPRAEWGARYGRGSVGKKLRSEVIIHTTVTGLMSENASLASEASVVRGMENYHVKNRGFNGLAYSFCVSDSGRIYEARGWGRNGAHTQNGGNSSGYAIAFIGDGTKRAPSAKAWAAAKWLIGVGVEQGYITQGYRLTGHRDWWKKECPGDLIYNIMKANLLGITDAGPGRPDDWLFGPGDHDNNSVFIWQSQLRDMFGAGIVADGDFGPITENITKEFEQVHGLEVNGYVSRQDVDKMVELYEKATEAASSEGDTTTADKDEESVEPEVSVDAPRHYKKAVRHGSSAADERVARALASALHLHVARIGDDSTVETVYLVGGDAVRDYNKDRAEEIIEVSGANRQETLDKAAKIMSDYLNTL